MQAFRTLRYCRTRAGLSQRELADRAQMAQPAIARIESGRVVPRLDTLRRLVAACGFTLEVRASTGIDRTAIRELRRLSPRERLDLAAVEARNLGALVGP